MGKGSKKVTTIGYKYFLGMHMVICHTPDELKLIEVGERNAWSGSVTGNQQIYVNAPDLFGGEKKEGGVQGAVDIMFGGPTQAKNDYLVSQLGSILPAFRGVLSVVLRQCFVAAMSPYPKAWAFLVKSIPQKEWYPATADINGGANAAHIIREVLTNASWGMGYTANTIDDASFRAVALQLYNEGLGLSFELTNTDSIENFIYTVVQHINGMFYTRPDNGNFALKLLREDYTASLLPTYDESNIITLENFERPSYAEMVNEIVVTYRPQGTSDDDSVTVQDLAAIQAQEGIISQALSYPGIDNATNAARVAMRDLRQKSTPLARVKLKVLRSAWNTAIGDCVNFKWSAHGVDGMVLRVLGVNLGSLVDGSITIDAIEDVFGLPNATYIGDQPSGWVDPVAPPSPALFRNVFEVPYWDIARSLSESEFSYLTNTSAYLATCLGQPTSTAINYELWTKPNSGDWSYCDDGNFAPHCLLSSQITHSQTTMNVSTFRGNITDVVGGTYGFLDSEIVRIDSLNTLTGELIIGRGCLDTVPAIHVSGTRLYFSEGRTAIDPTEYTTGETINVKELIRTGQGLLSISTATQDNLTLVGRFAKPYPPGNLRLNNVLYATTVTDDMVISWSHRDRTQQLATIIDHTVGNIGPEVGTTYSIEIRKSSDNSLMESGTGIIGTSFSSGLYFPSILVRVILWSVVSGRKSYQSVNYEFVLNNPQNLLTQDGEMFTTEDGDHIIL